MFLVRVVTCMVSLLGRAKKLYEPKDFFERLSIPPAGMIWRSMLSACRVVGNLEVSIYALGMSISYILLFSIYANNRM
ncbi:hypothetical protein Hanom_Chr12g01071281 [Helianthus anomalus]